MRNDTQICFWNQIWEIWFFVSIHQQHICIGWCSNVVSISPWPWEMVIQPIRLSSRGANNLFQPDSSRTVVLYVVPRGTWHHCCVSHCAKDTFKPGLRHVCRGLIGTAFQITSKCSLVMQKIALFFLSRLPKINQDIFWICKQTCLSCPSEQSQQRQHPPKPVCMSVYRSIHCSTTRLQSSFFPQATRLLKSPWTLHLSPFLYSSTLTGIFTYLHANVISTETFKSWFNCTFWQNGELSSSLCCLLSHLTSSRQINLELINQYPLAWFLPHIQKNKLKTVSKFL